MEIVVERLQGHNIKPSVQRIAIMKYLMEHAENFERARSCTDADH